MRSAPFNSGNHNWPVRRWTCGFASRNARPATVVSIGSGAGAGHGGSGRARSVRCSRSAR
jgi:hypothetical protein